MVRDSRDEDYVMMEANKAVLELRRNGGGPVHINLFTSYSRDFSVKTLPEVRVMHRFMAWDKLPEMPEGRIGVCEVLMHTFHPPLFMQLIVFVQHMMLYVICDHTSGYYGKYRLLPTLAELQPGFLHQCRHLT